MVRIASLTTLSTLIDAVVLISHNLNNIFEVCDRITVMRQGENIGVFDTKNTTPDQIVSSITRGE